MGLVGLGLSPIPGSRKEAIRLSAPVLCDAKNRTWSLGLLFYPRGLNLTGLITNIRTPPGGTGWDERTCRTRLKAVEAHQHSSKRIDEVLFMSVRSRQKAR